MADDGGNADQAVGYAAQLDTLRSVAKWLVAAFAGVGVVLVAGLSLSGIGQLPSSSWRLYAAAGSAAVALAAVGFMIREASSVLTHEWLTPASFSAPGSRVHADMNGWEARQRRNVRNLVEISEHELFGYAAESLAQLQVRLSSANTRLWKARPGSRRAARLAQEALVLRQAARTTTQYANYCYTLRLFRRMRVRLAWAGLVTVVSVGAFAYATNPPKAPAHDSVPAVMRHTHVAPGSPSIPV